MTKRILNTITEYVEPSDLFTEKEQLDQCCGKVSADPCVEVGRVDPYVSADIEDLDLEKLLHEARAKHPGKNIVGVQVEDVGPTGDCGTMYTDWSGRKNCCDEVEPLALDNANSIEVMADNAQGGVAVTGGKLPLTVSVRGQGFSLDTKGLRDGIVNTRNFNIYTADACGSAVVTINDGCSAITHTVRSTNGVWEGVYNNPWGGLEGSQPDDPEHSQHVPAFIDASMLTGIFPRSTGGTLEGVSGKYKVTQEFATIIGCFQRLMGSTAQEAIALCPPYMPGGIHACSTYTSDPWKFTGSAFYDPSFSCTECGECPDYNYVDLASCNVGARTGYYPVSSIWFLDIQWIRVGFTKVWEWKC